VKGMNAPEGMLVMAGRWRGTNILSFFSKQEPGSAL